MKERSMSIQIIFIPNCLWSICDRWFWIAYWQFLAISFVWSAQTQIIFHEDYTQNVNFEMNDQLIGDFFCVIDCKLWCLNFFSTLFISIERRKNTEKNIVELPNERSWSIWKWNGLMKLESNILYIYISASKTELILLVQYKNFTANLMRSKEIHINLALLWFDLVGLLFRSFFFLIWIANSFVCQ